MSGLKRLPNWRARFEEACDRMKYDPFEWEKNDCAIGLAGNIVFAITGVDVVAQYRGKYSSAESGYKLMKKSGFDNIGDMVASIIPEYPEGACRAKIGDIVAQKIDTPFGWALGVVNGERVFALTATGHGTQDLLDFTRAFKVG